MKTYAIMLDIRGRRVAIIGGGPVALRKARSALEAGAVVTLICPDPPAKVPAGPVKPPAKPPTAPGKAPAGTR